MGEKRRIFALVLSALLIGAPCLAHSSARDQMILAEACPTDDSREGVVTTAILTALIPRIVGGGLNALASKLSKAAESGEVVATASKGDYLYRYDVAMDPPIHEEESWRHLDAAGNPAMGPQCLIYASGSIDPEEDWPQEDVRCGDDRISSPLSKYPGRCALLRLLRDHGYEHNAPPRTLLVSKVSVSQDRSAFRLEPTYLFYAASPNESRKRTGQKKRKLAFAFTFARPDAAEASGQKVFAVPVVEILGVAPGVTNTRENGKRKEVVTELSVQELQFAKSNWFSMPGIGAQAAELIASDAAELKKIRENLSAAATAYRRAIEFRTIEDQTDWASGSVCSKPEADPFDKQEVPNRYEICQGKNASDWTNALSTYQSRHWLLSRELAGIEGALKSASDSEKRQLGLKKWQCEVALESLALKASYASGCQTMLSGLISRRRIEADLAHFEPFDVSLKVVEDYDKPFLSFMAEVLGDEELQTEVTTALSNQLDPAKRKEAKSAEEEQEKAAYAAYEEAVVAAQKADIEYRRAAAGDDPLAAEARAIDMGVAKLKANRLAKDIDVALPFPEVGTEF